MSFVSTLGGSAPPPPPVPLVDPYGIDVAIDPSGDLRVTASGSLGLVAGVYNCAQAVWLRLRTPHGDLPLHPEYGSRLSGELIGSKMNPAALVTELNAELQDLLADDARFTSAQVSGVQEPATTGVPGSIALAVTATLAGGEQLQLANVADPTPSDVTLPAPVAPSADPTLAYDPTVEQEFFADQPELDSLNDLNTVASLVGDIPPASATHTGEG